jgi:hypothetical protein
MKYSNSYFTGNLHAENKEERGWFIGAFLSPRSRLYSNDFEIKWANHKKGERRIEASSNNAKSMCILIRGKQTLELPELGKKYILEEEGDYAFWDEGLLHTWETLEDAVTFNIRWPSRPN